MRQTIIVVKAGARVTVNKISPCRRGEARMTNWWTVPDWRSPPGEVQHSSRVYRESVTQAGYILHFTSPTHYTSELHSTIGLVEPNTVFTTAWCLLWSGSFLEVSKC